VHWKHIAAGVVTVTTAILIVSNLKPQVTYGAIFNEVDTGTFVNVGYQYLLKRNPDPTGFPFWKGLLDKQKLSRKDFLFALYRSNEYQNKNKISSLSNQQFIVFLYQDLLKREGTQSDLGYWLNQIKLGQTRNEVAKRFIIAPEFEVKFSDFLKSVIFPVVPPSVVPPPIVLPPVSDLTPNYLIGAWYFTAWSSENDVHIPWAEKTYGRKDVWAGVRDHAEGKDPWNLKTDYSYLRPQLGFYNQLDQNIVDQHIQQASKYGIDYFAAYWYWDTDKSAESGVSTPLHRLTTSPFKNQIKFVLAPIKLGSKPMTLEEWKNKVVPFMVNNYIADTAYLKTKDGRPIIFDFEIGFNDADLHRQALDLLRTAVKNKIGKDPMIFEISTDQHKKSDLTYAKDKLKVDGFFCFQHAPKVGGEQYSTTIDNWRGNTENIKDFVNIPCASVGFDRRPWFGVGGLRGPGSPASPNQDIYNIGVTEGLFRQHLVDVKNYMDGNANTLGLVIYAWNEWGESGILEPSDVYGIRYLKTVKEVFGSSSLLPSLDCRVENWGKVFTGTHNVVGLSNGDTRFLCYTNKLYECGWELSDPAFAVKLVNNQQVGSWFCNLNNKKWSNAPVSKPLCVEQDWSAVKSPSQCPSTGQQTITWTKTGQCEGGVVKPSSETVICLYQPPTPPPSSDFQTCKALKDFNGTAKDASSVIQRCIDSTIAGGILELPAGKYYVAHQIKITNSLTLKTAGQSEADAKCNYNNDPSCAEIIASPDFIDKQGVLLVKSNDIALDHIVLNGNKLGRAGKAGAVACTSGEKGANQYGMVSNFRCLENCKVTNSVFKNALCGTALGTGNVIGNKGEYVNNFTIEKNSFVFNGVHNKQGLWSDGLTFGDGENSVIKENELIDNTDVQLIVGTCLSCKIQKNIIKHTGTFQGSSFAALMFHNWGQQALSGYRTGSDISNNEIDCGDNKRCGFGLYIGNDVWTGQKLVELNQGGSFHDNIIKNAQQGFIIDDAHDLEIYNNKVINSGGSFRASCGLKTGNAYNIGLDSRNIDRVKDETPDSAYTHISWNGCIPNWWTGQ